MERTLGEKVVERKEEKGRKKNQKEIKPEGGKKRGKGDEENQKERNN